MTRQRRLGVLVGLLSVVVATGCSEDGPDPGTRPTASVSSPSGDASTGTESGEPSVAPASGELMETVAASMNAPDGWKLGEVTPDLLRARKGPMVVRLNDFGPTPISEPRDLADVALEDFLGDPDVSYDAELGGEPAYELTASGRGRSSYELGAAPFGRALSVSFQFYQRVPEPERQELIDSVLATFVWN